MTVTMTVSSHSTYLVLQRCETRARITTTIMTMMLIIITLGLARIRWTKCGVNPTPL